MPILIELLLEVMANLEQRISLMLVIDPQYVYLVLKDDADNIFGGKRHLKF